MICDHSSVVDDVRQGDVICLDCGLVLDKIYQNESANLSSPLIEEYSFIDNENYINNGKHVIKKKNKCLSEETVLLITLFDRLHLNDKIKNTILEEWKKIKDWLVKSKKKYKANSKALIVMAIYEGLIKEKVPRPISHLCQDIGVQPKSVWLWIKLYKEDAKKGLSYKQSVFNTVDMLEYFLQSLSLRL